jgi:hypothetical protein
VRQVFFFFFFSVPLACFARCFAYFFFSLSAGILASAKPARLARKKLNRAVTKAFTVFQLFLLFRTKLKKLGQDQVSGQGLGRVPGWILNRSLWPNQAQHNGSRAARKELRELGEGSLREEIADSREIGQQLSL